MASTVRQWRPIRAGRLWACVLIACLVPLTAWTVIAALDDEDPLGAAGLLLLFLPIPIVLWLGFMRTSISADEHGVTVRNPLSTRFLRYSEIVDCKPGYFGIAIYLNSGKTVTAIAVQKSNLARWTGRRTRGDQVADFINQRARSAQA